MLTKIIGTSQVLTLSATTQTVSVTTTEFGNNQGLTNTRLPAVKVRIATQGQPAYIGLGFANTLNLNGVLIPANHAEHFKLDNTSTVSVLQAGTTGTISITPVA
jgi:hypothetical protein